MEKASSEYNYSVDIPGNIKLASLNARMISNSIITNDYDSYIKYKKLLSDDLESLEFSYKSSADNVNGISSTNILTIPMGNYAYDTLQSNYLTEFYNKLLTNIKFVLNRGIFNILLL